MLLTPALFVIEVHSTMRTKPAAITPANHLHRQSQIHLLGQHVSQKHPIAFKKPNIRLIQIQLRLILFRNGSHRAVEEIKILADFLSNGIQAARANQLQLGMQIPSNPNLPVQQLRRRPHLKRLDLPEVRRMQINSPGSIRLPYAGLMQREFVNIKKHDVIRKTQPKFNYKASNKPVKKRAPDSIARDTN